MDEKKSRWAVLALNVLKYIVTALLGFFGGNALF